MTLNVKGAFFYSTFCIHSTTLFSLLTKKGGGCYREQIPGFACRKCENVWNRWFKRQLARRTAADLFNSVVTWSKDDHQLIPPNYSDMFLECLEAARTERLLLPQAFLRASAHVSSSEKPSVAARGKKAEERSEKGGTGGPRWQSSRSPKALCRVLGAICGFSQQRPRKTSRAAVWPFAFLTIILS